MAENAAMVDKNPMQDHNQPARHEPLVKWFLHHKQLWKHEKKILEERVNDQYLQGIIVIRHSEFSMKKPQQPICLVQ
jgi:hypothetical protein